MDTMRPWLQSVILPQIGAEVLSRLDDAPEKGAVFEAGVLKLVIDIANYKLSRVLQIVRFLSFERPIEAEISDGEVLMQAEFTTAAVKAFETSNHGQRITYKTVGGVLQLKNCALHLELSPSANRKAVLIIENCQYLGSGGAGKFGQLRSFQALDGIRHKLASLSHALNLGRMGKSDTGSNVSQVVRSKESRAVSTYGAMDLHPDTQHSFSTQRVPSRSEISGISDERPSSVRSSHEPGEVLDSIQRNFDPLLMPSISRDKVLLLDLLHKHTRAVPKESRPTATSFKTTDRKAEGSRGPLIRSLKSDEHGSNVPVKRENELQSKIAIPAQATPSPNNLIISSRGGGGIRARIYRNQDRLSADALLFGPGTIKKRSKNFQDRDTESKGRTAEIAGKEANQSIRNEFEAPTPDSALAGCAVTWDVPDPWQGCTKIRKRDLKIPKDQQMLLERDDCWMPPEPGCRGPVTNIPTTVLKQLNKHAEKPLRRSPSPAPSVKKQTAHDTRSAQEETPSGYHSSQMTVDTQSDVLPWSLTPSPLVDGELPPDSSPEPSVHGRRARTSTRMSSPNKNPNRNASVISQHTLKRTWNEGQGEYPEHGSQRPKRKRRDQVEELERPSSSISPANASKSHQISTVKSDVQLRVPNSGLLIQEPATAATVQDSAHLIRNRTPASTNFTGTGSFSSSTLGRLGTLSNPSKHDCRTHNEGSDGLQETASLSPPMSGLKMVGEPGDNPKRHKASPLELLERYGSRTVPTMSTELRDLKRSDTDSRSKRRTLQKIPSSTTEVAMLDAHSSFNTTSRNPSQGSSTPSPHCKSTVGLGLEHAKHSNLGHPLGSGSSLNENVTRPSSSSSLITLASSLSKRTPKTNRPEHSTSQEETAKAAATVAVIQQASTNKAAAAAAAADKEEEEEGEEEDHNNEIKAWWEDEHTPMKDYVRSYLKLRSVQGQLGSVDDDHQRDPGRIRPIQTQLNILSWEL